MCRLLLNYPNLKILFLLKEYSWIIRVGNAFELEVLKDEK